MIKPVEPGFRFECQRCGNCCSKLNLVLSLDELTMFVKFKITDIHYTITIRKADGMILTIFPCKPPGVRCLGYMQDDTGRGSCIIYDKRPATCKSFPMVLRIYYDTPPRYEELIQSLRLENKDLSGIRIKPFIRKIDKKRWVFLGYEDRMDRLCLGIGKGPAWSENDIKNHIAHNIYINQNAKEQMNETTNVLSQHLIVNFESDLEKFFTLKELLFEDDDIRIILCKAIKREPGDLLGSRKIKGPEKKTDD